MVVTVVGEDGGASGGGLGEHGGGCPLATDELGDPAPDTCFAVWVQPAAPPASYCCGGAAAFMPGHDARKPVIRGVSRLGRVTSSTWPPW